MRELRSDPTCEWWGEKRPDGSRRIQKRATVFNPSDEPIGYVILDVWDWSADDWDAATIDPTLEP